MYPGGQAPDNLTTGTHTPPTFIQVEEHMFQGRPRTLLVHRKGSTRAFPPHHPLIPVDYQFTGAVAGVLCDTRRRLSISTRHM